jgi:hypothetical protein
MAVNYVIYDYNDIVGAFPLRKTASNSINKKRSQQCKQVWMRSAAQALCSFKSTASVPMVTIDNTE